jgi:hypothetical protein
VIFQPSPLVLRLLPGGSAQRPQLLRTLRLLLGQPAQSHGKLPLNRENAFSHRHGLILQLPGIRPEPAGALARKSRTPNTAAASAPARPVPMSQNAPSTR